MLDFYDPHVKAASYGGSLPPEFLDCPYYVASTKLKQPILVNDEGELEAIRWKGGKNSNEFRDAARYLETHDDEYKDLCLQVLLTKGLAVIDIDADKKTGELSDEQLRLLKRLRDEGHHVRRSGGGKGYHILCWCDGDTKGIPAGKACYELKVHGDLVRLHPDFDRDCYGGHCCISPLCIWQSSTRGVLSSRTRDS